ncbi:MAG: hypothetical protein NT166_31465 [Candidatus Aminicenantes bacterium]|nr:hypothetical protein [Candidatus Aminicenantes bacterium]
MRTNHVTVSKNLIAGFDIEVHGVDSPPNYYVIDDNNPLKIGLVHDNMAWAPRDSYQKTTTNDVKVLSEGETIKFYIKLESYKDFDFNICMNESGWKISQKCCLLSSKTVLISRLPKQINIWPVRLLLLPIELVLKVLQFIGALGRFIIDAIIALTGVTGNTNITVGGEA